MVESYREELKQRAETRQALEAMLELIVENSEYINQKTDSRMIGMLIGNVWMSRSDEFAGNLFAGEYHDKLKMMQTGFKRAKEAFDRSVHLETLKIVAGIGKYYSVIFNYTLEG